LAVGGYVGALIEAAVPLVRSAPGVSTAAVHVITARAGIAAGKSNDMNPYTMNVQIVGLICPRAARQCWTAVLFPRVKQTFGNWIKNWKAHI
jgi:hypothetical protein